MPAMDEKVPGSAKTPNWFVQALQNVGMATRASQPLPAPTSQGVVSPARLGVGNQAPAPPVQAPTGGGQAPRIPQLPQVNQTSLSSQGPLPIPQMGGGQTEFNTKGGRDAAIITGAVNNITDSIHRWKVEGFQRSAAQAEQIWGNYLALSSAAENEQDPQKKQQMQQLAQQMLQDKKVAKVIEKAQKDPMSGEGVGLQRAIQGSASRAAAQAQLEHVYAQIQAEQMRAQQEQATAGLRTRQTELEGQVAPKDEFNRQTELMKFNQQMQQKGYNLEVRGLTPSVKAPDGTMWSWNDIEDPARRAQMPPDAIRTLMAERQSKMQEIAEQDKRQTRAFGQQMAVIQQHLENLPKAGAAKLYTDQAENTLGNDMRYARMTQNYEKALRGDQQAMVSILSDHVAMTLRQPGKNAQRPTLEQWKEAQQSSDLLNSVKARFDQNGVLRGVVLTPEQMKQMTDLARQQHQLDWITTYTAYKNAGLDPKKMPLPQTLPGLEVVPFDAKLAGHEGGSAPAKLSPDDQKILDLLNK